MVKIENCTALVDGYNYCVYYPFLDGVFIMHIQGDNRRKLYNLTKEIVSNPTYFCAKDKKMWGNHSKLYGHFDNGLEIYKLVTKRD